MWLIMSDSFAIWNYKQTESKLGRRVREESDLIFILQMTLAAHL